jgi:hypothetical protein
MYLCEHSRLNPADANAADTDAVDVVDTADAGDGGVDHYILRETEAQVALLHWNESRNSLLCSHGRLLHRHGAKVERVARMSLHAAGHGVDVDVAAHT